ncbi:MobA/MobL family protein [Otoolea muris]|uniref:MobA/MobL family protein n=1 Tax=Otoolea muris TaxID=2941515 RepID=UPI00203A72CB|nr:MobA/MobL family protein [Otoolea muris]
MDNITKQASTRFSIVRRSKGQSAVEKASYVSRSVLLNEFDGQTYRPKYHEDLVHSEILLPPNAPREYADRAALWNAVELAEKRQDAQLARMLKASLPNEWSYELAEEVVRDYVQRNFVDKGMCADWAIHDSENDKGQRNLHIHVLLTMRPLTEKGEWGAKQKKIYDLDENGEKIPVIDKKTGQQKVDKRNRKQWKCHTADSTDWSSQENAKKWRKDLADTINAANERLGIALHWEHRSFKEQGIDKEPTIHIGAVANALERKGIQTERGNINREIIKHNKELEQAKEMLMLAKQEVHSAQYAKIKNAAVSVMNEVMEMIAKVRGRKGRLDLPIVSGKHLRKMTDRTALQSADNAEKFVTTRKIDSFESLAKFTEDREQKYQQLETVHLSKGQKLNRLKELSKIYALYAPIQAEYKESQSLKGLAKMKYDKEHKDSLSKYPELKERMQSLLQNGEKITPKQWKAEIQSLQAEYDSIGKEQTKTATELAYAEVIGYNKKNLERELQNESRQHNRQQSKAKQREEEI